MAETLKNNCIFCKDVRGSLGFDWCRCCGYTKDAEPIPKTPFKAEFRKWDPDTDCARNNGCRCKSFCRSKGRGCPYEPNDILDDLSFIGGKMNPNIVLCPEDKEEPVPCPKKWEDTGSKDQTGTLDKPNLIRDALQEFPFAQYALADLTKEGLKKHPSRGWRNRKYTGGTYETHLAYFTGKAGRHIACREIYGEVNEAEGNQLHMVAAAWSLMGYVDTMLRKMSEDNDNMTPDVLLKAIKEGNMKP